MPITRYSVNIPVRSLLIASVTIAQIFRVYQNAISEIS